MSKLPTPRDPIEALGEAYELLLEKAIEEARNVKEKTGPVLHKIIDTTSQKLSEIGELTEEEAEKVSDYLKRDLKEAASYMNETGEDFRKWLAIDTEMMEDYLLNRMIQAADQTTVELLKLKAAGESAQYHTGEITGPGVLMCDECGENIHFHKAGRIPPCPKCKATAFHRLFCR